MRIEQRKKLVNKNKYIHIKARKNYIMISGTLVCESTHKAVAGIYNLLLPLLL